MIKYICNVCGEINSNMRDANTNKCLGCKRALEEEKEKKIGVLSKDTNSYKTKKDLYSKNYVKNVSEIFWCKNHNIPLFYNTCKLCTEQGLEQTAYKIASDIRPVFYEERLLIAALINDEDVINKAVWHTSSNRYVIDGEILKISKKSMMEKNPNEVSTRIQCLTKKHTDLLKHDISERKDIKDFIYANKERLIDVEFEAFNFIKEVSMNYNEREKFVSFSGGKDSTVIHDLVYRAFPDEKFFRIFGNTTLEYPETEQYFKRLRRKTSNLPFFEAKNKEDDFYSLCKIIGPPSRVLRWCCTYFKTGVISSRMDKLTQNSKKVISYQGIRRSESNSRNKYERFSNSPKIAKQKVASPIIDWLDFDVWLYILSKKIDFNDAYRKGFARVGCWCCPNNSKWAEYLAKIYYPEQSKKWNDILMEFALATNKSEPENYVSDGSWKARQGGNGLELSKNGFLSYVPCVVDEKVFNYELTRDISEELYELFKPFGSIRTDIGNQRLNEVFIVDNNETPFMKIQGKTGTKNLNITILNKGIFIKEYKNKKINNYEDIKRKIDCQLTKYQMCLGCGGCESVCRFDAIHLDKDKNRNQFVIYTIDENKCVMCKECIDHFENGCYMKKILRTKRRD